MNINKYIAEGFGTLALTLAVLLSISGSFPISTALVAGYTLGLLVYAIGTISGAHINPAITIGLWSLKKIKGTEAIFYIVAQLAGAIVARLIASVLVSLPNFTMGPTSWLIFWAELVGAVFFAFCVAAVATHKVHEYLSGIVIGGGLIVGIAIASSASAGILNPAVAVGLSSLSLAYVLGPIIGALIGMKLFQFISKP